MLPIRSTSRTRKIPWWSLTGYIEGINIGSGVQGLITYMRTDSTRISPVAAKWAAELYRGSLRWNIPSMEAEWRRMLLVPKMPTKRFVHPASSILPESIAKYLDKDQLKLYTLIWNRFVASQMTAAVFDTMNVRFRSKWGSVYGKCGAKWSLMVIWLFITTQIRTRCCRIRGRRR